MKPQPDEPLRGDAAWQATKARIAARNDATRARGAKMRAATEAAKIARRRADDARERDAQPLLPRSMT